MTSTFAFPFRNFTRSAPNLSRWPEQPLPDLPSDPQPHFHRIEIGQKEKLEFAQIFHVTSLAARYMRHLTSPHRSARFFFRFLEPYSQDERMRLQLLEVRFVRFRPWLHDQSARVRFTGVPGFAKPSEFYPSRVSSGVSRASIQASFFAKGELAWGLEL